MGGQPCRPAQTCPSRPRMDSPQLARPLAGQLGLGQFVVEDTVQQPTAIFGLPTNRFALPAAGRVHSVLATDDTQERLAAGTEVGRAQRMLTMCHSWGAASNGRLGTGMYEDSTFPELVPDLDGEQILDLACGLDHTLALIRL